MKQLSTALAAHLAGDVTTLATCWKITRSDGTVLGFTDHDADISLSGVTYQAASGFTPSAIASSASLNVDNLEVEGVLASGTITEADLMAGRFDFSAIEIFMVNYADLSQGTLKLRYGRLGEVSLKQGQFVAEMRGLTQALSQNIGELYSPSCRATLGDARCMVNLSAYTASGSITSFAAGSRQIFTDTGRSEASGLFAQGLVTFTSGANAGLAMEVKDYTFTSGGGVVTFVLSLPYDFTVGDAYTISQGCDKTFATCTGRFGNSLNFRGEPQVPGIDRMLETAGTRSEW